MCSSSFLSVLVFPGKGNYAFSQQVPHFCNGDDAYKIVRLSFHMDVPSSGIVSLIEMQGLGTRIPGIQFFYPAMNLLFQILQCVPVLEQAVLELQDMALELAAFPIDRRISLYIMYKLHTIMILTVYSISSPHKSRSLGAVLI